MGTLRPTEHIDAVRLPENGGVFSNIMRVVADVKEGLRNLRAKDYFGMGLTALTIAGCAGDFDRSRTFTVGDRDAGASDSPAWVKNADVGSGDLGIASGGEGSPDDAEDLEEVDLKSMFSGPFDISVEQAEDGIVLEILGKPLERIELEIILDGISLPPKVLEPGKQSFQIPLDPASELIYLAFSGKAVASGVIPLEEAEELEDLTNQMGAIF